MNLCEEERAQGSMEYLLILAGAILVAILVGLFLKGIPGATGHKINAGAHSAIHGF